MCQSVALRMALLLAAKEGNVEQLQKLIPGAKNIEAKDANGLTALHWAAFRGHEAAVNLLAEEGADLHSQVLALRT